MATVVLAGCNQQQVADVLTDDSDDTMAEENMAADDMNDDEDMDDEEDEMADADDMDGEYAIDTEASTVGWFGTRIAGGHEGVVTVKEGVVSFEDGDITNITAVIDMTTIVSMGETQSEMLDNHLKSDDFFAVETYPTATIQSTSIDGNTVTADLTIKDETHPVTFDVIEEDGVYLAEFTIDRTLWGVVYGSDNFFDDLKDKAIKDEIEFDISVVLEANS